MGYWMAWSRTTSPTDFASGRVHNLDAVYNSFFFLFNMEKFMIALMFQISVVIQ